MIPSLLLVACLQSAPTPPTDELLTVAERSGFEATSTHAEVMELIAALAERSEHLRVGELGRSVEGRVLPLLVLAHPPVADVTEVPADDRTRVFAFGNIHAGEVCGKEALLMLARELALDAGHPLLEHLVVAIAPIYNADGNDPFSPRNRPGQVGPAQGVGRRPNAQGLDLNRDYVKLESPEARAQMRFHTKWDPHVTIDTHTTNGSFVRYHLTYSAPLNPSGFLPSIELARDELLPEVSRRLRERTGWETFSYGNFNRARDTWSTYSAQPRFGGNYLGLRGQMSILSEAYAYATYEERVLATREFVREILGWVAENGERVRELHERARTETTAAGENPQPDDVVGIRHRLAPAPRLATVLGFVEEPDESGRPRPTGEPLDRQVLHLDRFEPTLSVRRPHAYLIPPGLDAVVENLRLHGVRLEPWSGRALVEAYTILDVRRRSRPFQGHRTVELECEAELCERELPEGSWICPTGQPLGNLIVYLLEPQSEDGLVTWSFLDEHLKEGRPYPILRVRSRHDLR